MKIMILPSSSPALEEESIIMDSPMGMATDSRMTWQSVMTVTTRKIEKKIQWRSKLRIFM